MEWNYNSNQWTGSNVVHNKHTCLKTIEDKHTKKEENEIIITSCCNGWGGGEDDDSKEVEEVVLSWRSSTNPRYFKALSPESTQVTA